MIQNSTQQSSPERKTIREVFEHVGGHWSGNDNLCPTFGSAEALRIYTVKMQREAVQAALAAQPAKESALQRETFAWAAFAENGNVIIWSKLRSEVEPVAKKYGRPVVPVVALDVAAPDAMSQAERDVLAERRRQVEAEGWTPDHDDKYKHSELKHGAAAYALAGDPHLIPRCWPWATEWWKPADDRRNLVKAAALILADIERLDRATASASLNTSGNFREISR